MLAGWKNWNATKSVAQYRQSRAKSMMALGVYWRDEKTKMKKFILLIGTYEYKFI